MTKIIDPTNQVKDVRVRGGDSTVPLAGSCADGGEIRHVGDDSFYLPETRALRRKFEQEIDA
jgi:hypothetical protein